MTNTVISHIPGYSEPIDPAKGYTVPTVADGTHPRGPVHERTGSSGARSWSWIRVVRGTLRQYTLVAMPDGEVRIITRAFTGYVGGIRYDMAFGPARWITIAAPEVPPTSQDETPEVPPAGAGRIVPSRFLLDSVRGAHYAYLLRSALTDPTSLMRAASSTERGMLINKGLVGIVINPPDPCTLRVTPLGRATLIEFDRTRAAMMDARTRSAVSLTPPPPCSVQDAHGLLVTPGALVRPATLPETWTGTVMSTGQHSVVLTTTDGTVYRRPAWMVELVAPVDQLGGDQLPQRQAEPTERDGTPVVIVTPAGVVDGVVYGGVPDGSGQRTWAVRHTAHPSYATYPASVVRFPDSDLVRRPDRVPFAAGVRVLRRRGLTLPGAITLLRQFCDPDGDATVTELVSWSHVEVARAQWQRPERHAAPRIPGRPLADRPHRVVGRCGHEMPTHEWHVLGYRSCEYCVD